jgi:hypothetical protein
VSSGSGEEGIVWAPRSMFRRGRLKFEKGIEMFVEILSSSFELSRPMHIL